MRFTKPINREVEIDGNACVVTVEEAGVGFRLKGKRKTARVSWGKVLGIAEDEGGLESKNFRETGGDSSPDKELQKEAGDDFPGLSHTATAGERGPAAWNCAAMWVIKRTPYPEGRRSPAGY